MAFDNLTQSGKNSCVVLRFSPGKSELGFTKGLTHEALMERIKTLNTKLAGLDGTNGIKFYNFFNLLTKTGLVHPNLLAGKILHVDFFLSPLYKTHAVEATSLCQKEHSC